MKPWDLIEDDENLGRTLQVLEELNELCARERGHLVALEHSALPVIHLRKVELVEELRQLRETAAQHPEEVAVYRPASVAEDLRSRIRLAADRLAIQARANQMLHEQIVSTLSIRLGREPDDPGIYDGRARRAMRAPTSRKRAA